jgi:hypothetical protein
MRFSLERWLAAPLLLWNLRRQSRWNSMRPSFSMKLCAKALTQRPLEMELTLSLHYQSSMM